MMAVLLHEWFHCLVVDDLSSIGGRKHHPNEESDFDVEVEGNIIQNETKEIVKGLEDTKDTPVSKPDLVVIFIILCLKGLNALHARVEHRDKENQDDSAEENADDEDPDNNPDEYDLPL